MPRLPEDSPLQEQSTEVSEYEMDLFIDPNALDIECLQQANHFFKYSKRQAEAARGKDRAEKRKLVVRGQLRKSMALAGEKVTEGSLDEALALNPISDELIEAKFEENMCEAAVKSFAQRKGMLDDLIQLSVQDYFAGPKEPRNLGAEYTRKKEQQKEGKKAIATALKGVRRNG